MNINGSEQRDSCHLSLIRFFGLTILISWGLWIPEAAYARGFSPVYISVFLSVIIGGFAPSLSAIVLTALDDGPAGIGRLFKPLTHWRVSILWYAAALFLPLLIIVCAMLLSSLWGMPPSILFGNINWVSVIPLFLFTMIFGGPLGEEIGWRGYLLPHLLKSKGDRLAGLIVGIVWGLWHLPLFFIPDSVQARVPIAWFMSSILAESLIYTWLYQRTGGSLLIMIIFHAAINTWARSLLFAAIEKGTLPLLITFVLEIILGIGLALFAFPNSEKNVERCAPVNPPRKSGC